MPDSQIVALGDGSGTVPGISLSNGQTPRDLAPNLYRLAWRKNLTVSEKLQNDNCTRGLWKMTNATDNVEFVGPWTRMQDIQLADTLDKICW
jgi:hypothetical protein